VIRSLALACLVAVSATCSAPQRAAAPPPKLLSVSLPDLSPMEPSVQRQMREAHSLLTAKREDPSTPPAELGRAYGDMGNLLLAAEYADAAEPCYLNAQLLVQDDIRWPYYLGHIYRTRGEPARAAESFERALKLRPNDVATLVWLGRVYLDQGRPEDAGPLFDRAISQQPQSVAALVGRGRTALAQRQFARAVDDLERALAIDPRASMARYPLALAYRGMGDVERAEAQLRQRGEVEVGPTDPLIQELSALLHSAVSYENRGVRALDGRDWATAATLFRRGLELSPDSPSLHHKLGTALSLGGDTRGAAEEFQAALRSNAAYPQAHFSLGVLLAASGRLPDAIERFAAAVRYDPNYVEARIQLAEALRRTGRPDAALPHYARAIAVDPRSPAARMGYALALAMLRRFPEAQEQLTEGMRLHPGRPEFAQALDRLRMATVQSQD
jgi:tetratricopeptide (TPR) repeat protein